MKQWMQILKKHQLFTLLIFYFLFTLINLTLLPIFNDESIYLDWGWLSIHVPGDAFISLTDSKQPLLIWIFGIFTSVFSDPLFAGRFVSVIIGSFTLAGMYSLSKKLFDKHIAFLAALIYTITPIFVFYNRQALMEASIACIGIWSGTLLLSLLQKPTIKRGVLLGIMLGIGFLIKSSSLLYIFSSVVLIAYILWREKKKELFLAYFFSLVTIGVVDFILLINPLFWQTFSSNSRYAYTPGELLAFPLLPWLEHLFGFLQVGFIFITPFVFLAGLFGIFLLVRKKRKDAEMVLFYFAFALLLEIITVKGQSQRYLIDYLPFFIIPAAYVFGNFLRGTLVKKAIVVVSLIIPLILSLMMLFNPQAYIVQLAKISSYSDTSDVTGYTAGYGVNETLQYIKEHSVPNQPTMVVFALWTGNPENALDVYSFKSENLLPLRIDSSFFPNLSNYQCMSSSYPLFFVTRDGIRAGLDNYFSLAKTIPTADPTYAIKIYTPKKNCTGKTLSLSDAYQPLMNKEMEIKFGL